MLEKLFKHTARWNTFISAEMTHEILQNGIKSGFPQIDALLGLYGLYPGSLTLIQGELPRAVYRTLITRLTTSLLIANPETELAFIDGFNIFPYYDLGIEAKRRGYDPLLLLDRIQLSRAFNFHQMTEILTKKLPQLLIERPQVQIVFAPQISSLHLSSEALEYLNYDKLTASASIQELTYALGHLKSKLLQHNLVGIITSSNAPKSRKPLGGTYLAHVATFIIRAELDAQSSRKEYELRFSVEKGGAMANTQFVQKEPQQSIPLTNFWI